MQDSSRTDRIIIALALAIIFLAGGAFYFDGWMWGTRRSRGERIGLLSVKQGDVRLKFGGDLKWQGASRGQDLIYNDAIYAGPGSEAKLSLGESEMVVSENTLVVLRKDDHASFMNLSYGSLFGRIAKNEKIVVDTGDGKPIQFKSSDQAQIVVNKTRRGKTEVRVTAGSAEIEVDGKKSVLKKSARIVVENHVAKIEEIALEALRPRREQVTYSDEPTRLSFAWRWSNGRRPSAAEVYHLEFSSSAGFEKISTTRLVNGQLDTTLAVSETLSFYYRVRGPRGELSQVEKASFVRLQQPEIVQPVARAEYLTSIEQPFPVAIEIRIPENMKVHYEIATNPDFKAPVVQETVDEPRQVKALPLGEYLIRARGDDGAGHLTRWSEPRFFVVAKKIEELHLSGQPEQEKFLIPNANYPIAMYSADPSSVRKYLASLGTLREFFPFSRTSFDELRVHVRGVRGAFEIVQKSTSWPVEKLQPGHYRYRYQASKAGFMPTPLSPDRTFEIAMEPPKPLSEAVYGTQKKNAERDATWRFTPILFARSYDVEVASDSQFLSALELKSSDGQVQVSLPPGEHFWRARARDAEGRVISEYSSSFKLAPAPAPAIPMSLAKNESRQPQAVERTRSRVERVLDQPYVKNGWWTWVGAGYNYVDYNQSIPGRGTVSDHRLKGPSEYGEIGEIGANNWGAVASYKRTPGEMNVTDASAGATYDSSYLWTTVSVEAILRTISNFTILDKPIVYGIRVGVQEHRTPFLVLNSAGTLDAKYDDMTTASAGVLAEWQRRRWTYYWLMRYQYPITAKADGGNFGLEPKFAFDGSVGTSYNFTQQFKMGLFWYGQWHQFDFNYSNADVTNSGHQSLFYSDIDLRFGFEF